MLDTIQPAKESIYIESFVLSDDSRTHNFFETLKNKATQGIRVKIIIDRIGNFWLGSINYNAFQNAGAEILFFNRWLYRTHRKILIVDEKTAFVGGVNIGGRYANWLDLHIRLRGTLVQKILHSFCKVYELAGGKDKKLISLIAQKPNKKVKHALYKTKCWLMEHSPVKGHAVLRDYYIKKCTEATKSIIIVTPYFIPHPWFIASLKKAVERGVKVEVLVPEKTDVWITNIANKVFGRILKDIPINFFFIPHMNHAKVLLVDEREGLIGSNNIDAQSFDFNLEASIVFQRKDMIENLKKIIDRWKKSARTSQPSFKWHWSNRLIEIFIKILQPIL